VPPQNVELLYFEGCPNHEAARELVERVAAEEGIEINVKRISVTSPEEAERLRFLGSPSVRVNGRDVEPGAAKRADYTLSCRVYRTISGVSGQLEERWLRDALVPS
jgi:hypothetical protein